MIRCNRKLPPWGTMLWSAFVPLAVIALIAAWAVPPTWWYVPNTIQIANAQEGDDPTVSLTRIIKRPFYGEYSVSVWRAPPEEDGHVACAGSDRLHYRGGLFRPHEDQLAHWASDPYCARLKPGSYYAQACWTILRPFGGIVPAKTVCAASNTFSINGRRS